MFRNRMVPGTQRVLVAVRTYSQELHFRSPNTSTVLVGATAVGEWRIDFFNSPCNMVLYRLYLYLAFGV